MLFRSLELKEPDTLELDDNIHLFTSYASGIILKLLGDRQDMKLNKEDVAKITDKIQRMDKNLDELINQIKTKRSLQRKQIMPFCLQCKDHRRYQRRHLHLRVAAV